MSYSIQINLYNDDNEITRIIRGDELSNDTLDLIDGNVKYLMDDMAFKTRNILASLELLEQYIDDHADSMAYKEQAIEDRRTLKKAIEELEAIL